jgi:hypothetical protein
VGEPAVNSKWHLRLLALLLAVLSWYLVTGRERVETWVRVRIEIAGLDSGLMLMGTPRDHLDALVRGPQGLIAKLSPQDLVYTLDGRKLIPGANTVAITPDSIPASKVFEVAEVRPSTLELLVDRRMTKNLPVRLTFKNSVAGDYQVSAKTVPDTVNISGPQSLLQDVKEVPSLPVPLPPGEFSGSFESQASLVLPDQTEASPHTVKAQVQFQMLSREVNLDLPVRLIYPGRGQATVNPGSVTVRARVPVALWREGGWRSQAEAQASLPAAALPGSHELTCQVHLPQGCELIETKPGKVRVRLK